MISVLYRGGSPALTKFFQYRENLARRSAQIVVDHLVGGQRTTFGQFRGGTRETEFDVFFIVAASSESFFELLKGRRHDQKYDSFGQLVANLFGALDLDL
jgi:hypothetical protein